MNIAIFTNNYLPNPYGVTGSIESFRKQFEKRGHTVHIFAPFYKNYQDKNSRVFRYPSFNINYKIKFPLAIPYSRKIAKEIEKLDFDIIHSQHPNLLGTAAKKLAKKRHTPLVFTWHTLYDQYTHFIPLIPKKIASHWIIKKAVNYANESDFVITPTDSVKKIIQQWGVKNNNIASVPTGVEEEYYQNADRNIIRNKLDLRENDILLLLVSRISEEKNVEFLFNSVIKILKSAENVKFLIAGEGHLVPKLKNLARKNNMEDKIIFEGIVAKEELKNYYAAADIFVYSSKSETQGMIVSEAMYLGLPIVAVDAPGICDLVENNINGFLVPEDENQFISHINMLINGSEMRKKFGEESKRIARGNFTDSICASKMLKIYDSLITSIKK